MPKDVITIKEAIRDGLQKIDVAVKYIDSVSRWSKESDKTFLKTRAEQARLAIQALEHNPNPTDLTIAEIKKQVESVTRHADDIIHRDTNEYVITDDSGITLGQYDDAHREIKTLTDANAVLQRDLQQEQQINRNIRTRFTQQHLAHRAELEDIYTHARNIDNNVPNNMTPNVNDVKNAIQIVYNTLNTQLQRCRAGFQRQTTLYGGYIANINRQLRQDQKADMKTQLQNIDNELTAIAAVLNDPNTSFSQQANNLTIALNRLQINVTQLQADLVDARKQFQTFIDDIDKVTKTDGDTKQMIAIITNYDNQIQAFQTQLNNNQIEIKKLQADITHDRQTIENYKTNARDDAKEIQELRDEVGRRTQAINDIKAENKKLNKSIADLTKDKDSCEQKIANIQADAEQRIKDVETHALKVLESEKTKLKKNRDQKESDTITDLKSKLENMELHNEALQKEIVECHTSIGKRNDKVAKSFMSQIQRLQNENKIAGDIIVDFAIEIEKIRQNVQAMPDGEAKNTLTAFLNSENVKKLSDAKTNVVTGGNDVSYNNTNNVGLCAALAPFIVGLMTVSKYLIMGVIMFIIILLIVYLLHNMYRMLKSDNYYDIEYEDASNIDIQCQAYPMSSGSDQVMMSSR
jgi:chromosome segregation ATPase